MKKNKFSNMKILGWILYSLVALVLFLSIFFGKNIQGVEKRYLWITEGILLVCIIIYELIKKKKQKQRWEK